ALLLHLAALLKGLLIEHADHVPGALVHDDLFLPELLARRRHPIAAAELRECDLEDAAEEIAEGIPGVPLRRRLGPTALRAHPVRPRVSTGRPGSRSPRSSRSRRGRIPRPPRAASSAR